MRSLLFLVPFVLASGQLGSAADLQPTLGKKGKILLEERFDGNQLPKGWNRTVGAMSVADGALRLSEVAADKHAGAFRKPLLVQNVAIQFDFKFDGAKMFHIGFDPATGELKKKGHLYSVVVNTDAWSILEHPDKSAPASKPVTHARAVTEFKRGQWYTLMLENKGATVVAHIDGKEPLQATASDFAVKKPGLVFRVGSSDSDAIVIDNVRVWELE